MVPWANVALLVIGLDFITGLEMEITAPKHGSTLALDAAEWLHVTVRFQRRPHETNRAQPGTAVLGEGNRLCLRINGTDAGCSGSLSTAGAWVHRPPSPSLELRPFSLAAGAPFIDPPRRFEAAWVWEQTLPLKLAARSSGGALLGPGRHWVFAEVRRPPRDGAAPGGRAQAAGGNSQVVASARPVAVSVPSAPLPPRSSGESLSYGPASAPASGSEPSREFAAEAAAGAPLQRAEAPPVVSGAEPREPDEEKWPSVSLVLTLTLRDVPRALVLVDSLGQMLDCPRRPEPNGGTRARASSATEPPPPLSQIPSQSAQKEVGGCWVEELLVVAPDREARALRTAFPSRGEGTALAAKVGQVAVVPESSLLPPGFFNQTPHGSREMDTYALAMLLKLLAARLVRGEYYLTLDADLVATKPRLGPTDLFAGTPAFFDSPAPDAPKSRAAPSAPAPRAAPRNKRAAFAAEPQGVHPHWWEGSAAALRFPEWARSAGGGGAGSEVAYYAPDPAARFGVTPAVVSTPGAMLVLARLAEVKSRARRGVKAGHTAGIPLFMCFPQSNP
eukprot:CAMPEP_0172586180 /NCGR_PEP_ID=MMETSP1068-20121228/5553_1 /TAXON_ID=35684 /ORGANISM="Pseudopedinella elastica, Strain CCMP716" /LENGTH=559 /DNA_ID=CAMNT_0013380887 /DNA_START=211 /DNA_END=1886 /DNA_ORIENTATION=+